MAGDTTITIIGNLTDDPELKFTSSGVAVANFRVASTPRFMDRTSGEWKDGDPLFMRCTVWRQAAENVAESLQRGARVVVVGRLRQRSYETQQGEKRTVVELEVDEVAPSLRYATARVQKMDRSNGAGTGGGYGAGGFGSSGTGNGGGNGGGGAARDGGGFSHSGSSGSGRDDPWANAPMQGDRAAATTSTFDDEPPF